ncbi:MAG: DUF4012 domain-containing protein [Patescibacteria group bacterium]
MSENIIKQKFIGKNRKNGGNVINGPKSKLISDNLLRGNNQINQLRIRQTAGLHNLSQHIVNLRRDLVKPNLTQSGSAHHAVIANRAMTSINFIKPAITALLVPWWKLEKKLPVISELTIFFVLEIIYILLYQIIKTVGRFYYRIYVNFRQVGISVAQDLIYYFELNWKVLTNIFTPWKLFKTNYHQRMSFTMPRLGQVGIFILIAMILVLPLKWVTLQQTFSLKKDQLLSFAYAALEQFSSGGAKLSSGDFFTATANFEQATKLVSQAQTLLNSINEGLAGLPAKLPVSASRIEAINNLLTVGQEISDSGIILSQTLRQLDGPVDSTDSINIAQKILLLQQGINQINPKIEHASTLLQSINQNYFPDDLKQSFMEFNNELSRVKLLFADISQLPNVLNKIFPQNGSYNYALIFQNYSELRATGGFMGSLAIIEIVDGKIKQIAIPGGGPYDFQGQLKIKVKPPEPLRLVNSLWQLQDANWFFDFPTSAKKILWFLDKSSDLELDGIIAINPDIVIELLKLTGPIDLSQYQKHITAENFIRETQEAVDIEYNRTSNRPKQFIADLAPLLIDKISKFDTINQLQVLDIFKKGLQQKSMQMFFTDAELEQQMVNQNWAGSVRPVLDDYLAIVRINIGGGKSDLVMTEKVEHQTLVLPTGEVEGKVIFTRTHNGDPLDIFYKRRNLSWIKFYLPLGSKLISASGFSNVLTSDYRVVPNDAVDDIDLNNIENVVGLDLDSSTVISEEFNKMVFSNWLAVEPGEQKTVEIKYSLPFTLENQTGSQDLRDYNIYFQKQSGAPPLEFKNSLILPDNFRMRWYESSDDMLLTNGGTSMSSSWLTDIFYGAIIEKIR